MEKEKIEAHLNFWPVFVIGVLFLISYLIMGLVFGFEFSRSVDASFHLMTLFFGLFCLFLSIPGLFKLRGWKYGWIIAIIGIVILITIWIRFME